jgi:serine/threonine protein phosphatase PrpC
VFHFKGDILKPVITSATHQGTRYYQEDRFFHIETKDGFLFGVFDGHGGFETAEFVNNKFPAIWNDWGNYSNEERMLVAFSQIDAITKSRFPGCTASVVFIPFNPDKVHIGILGDSPVIVKDDKGNIAISPEHNARTNLTDRQEAIEKGATYSGGYIQKKWNGAGLQLTRSFGDAELAASHES